MDKMHLYEVPTLLKYGYYRDKETWEQTRWLGNLYINAHSKSTVDIEDTIKFSWEKDDEAPPMPDRESLKRMADMFTREVKSSSVTLKELKS